MPGVSVSSEKEPSEKTQSSESANFPGSFHGHSLASRRVSGGLFSGLQVCRKEFRGPTPLNPKNSKTLNTLKPKRPEH